MRRCPQCHVQYDGEKCPRCKCWLPTRKQIQLQARKIKDAALAKLGRDEPEAATCMADEDEEDE
jgi:hypothetical protein